MRSCAEYAETLAAAVARASEGCECALLSGGIDTTFVALVHPRRWELRAFTVDLGGPDAHYAALAASRLGLRSHAIVKPSRGELDEAVAWVLASFRTVDPVEVSSSAVHRISVRAAAGSGCKCLLSGDGGDELFVGYTFLYGKSLDELRAWVTRMVRGARLPTVEVGLRMGFRVLAPLFSDEAKELALRVLEESPRCLTDGSEGKVLMRDYIRLRGLPEIASRPKTPVTSGTGVLGVLEEVAREEVTEDVVARVERSLGARLPSVVHYWLAWRMIEEGIEAPPRDRERPCPVCGRRLDDRYCRFCGTYVTERGVALHYSPGADRPTPGPTARSRTASGGR